MAFQTKKPASGNGPATGMPRTPAPLRQAPPDAVDTIRNPTKQNYGENGPRNNQSRTNPGQFVESDLARNMRQSSDDGENVLDKIIAGGAHENFQTRKLAPGNVPIAHGMQGASPGGTVPDKCGAPSFDPSSIRKP
jgi:hypothetical protein